MSNFIADFMELNGGTECHRTFLRWAAVSALGAAAGPRYRLLNGTYYVYPLMYIIYVGSQGCRKNYAMSQAKDFISEAFPDFPMTADITSRDDIVRLIASEDTERCYIDADGAATTYHPLALFISEFKDFTSYSPSMMINFIVNIYDYVDRIFRCSTIKRGAENSEHPFMPILACENTDWFIKRLKEGIVTGGFSRRFIVLFEDGKPEQPFPRIIRAQQHDILRARMIQHLRNLHTTARTYVWDPAGQAFFDKWYIKNFHARHEDSSIAGFEASLDQQVLKLCIILDLAEDKPKYILTKELIEEAITWFAVLKPNLIKLYSSGGRNELRSEQIKIIDLIESRGGIMTEKEVLRITGKDLGVREQQDSIKILTDTGDMLRQAFRYPDVEGNGVKTFLITKKGMADTKIASAIRKFNNGGVA